MVRDFDDLIGTISDADDISDEEAEEIVEVAPASKKRKREGKEQEKSVKKQKEDKDEDVESDFEFENEGGANALQELDAWATAGDAAAAQPGDIDAIIARRRSKKTASGGGESDIDSEEEEEREEELSGDEFHTAIEGLSGDEEHSDDEDGSIEAGAEDFEEDEDNEDEEEVAEGANEKEEEVLAHVPHPDDEDLPDSASDQEDAEEVEKRNAFFSNDEMSSKQAIASTAAFHSMNLSRPILKGLAAVGFNKPTPIQAKTIPVALEGKDLVGGAVTGSGKTGAFLIPILERLLYRPTRTPTTRVAILMPTRELALQCYTVAKKLASFTDITFGQAIGGMNSREQEKQLKLRPDIVIATPGRFIDLERNSASFAVNTIEILVLDEADRMLEEGFADELNEILSRIPKSRQTMLFSATMTSKVDDLIRAGLHRPVRLMVDAQKQTVSGLVQEFVRLRPGREQKRLGYLLYLCDSIYTDRVIVFFRQKKEAHRVRVIFALCGLKAAELHGAMSQEQRINAIESFRTGKASFLLATDLASRGLDIKGIETVVNYEAPQSHEIYLHRVGRTARAGRTGRSCTLAAEPDRKVVKAAVKTGKAQGAQIRQRTIDPQDVDKWHTRLESMQDEIDDVLREEKEERALQQTDRDLTRADNIVKYEDEIKSRPKKTWFESEKDKQSAREKGRTLLNGPADGEGGKKEKKGKLSNKEKKKLLARDDRTSGMEWKKSKAATVKGKDRVEKRQKKIQAKGKGKGRK